MDNQLALKIINHLITLLDTYTVRIRQLLDEVTQLKALQQAQPEDETTDSLI
jgi:hypothetical protein